MNQSKVAENFGITQTSSLENPEPFDVEGNQKDRRKFKFCTAQVSADAREREMMMIEICLLQAG
jgi:hypothetical protein